MSSLARAVASSVVRERENWQLFQVAPGAVLEPLYATAPALHHRGAATAAPRRLLRGGRGGAAVSGGTVLASPPPLELSVVVLWGRCVGATVAQFPHLYWVARRGGALLRWRLPGEEEEEGGAGEEGGPGVGGAVVGGAVGGTGGIVGGGSDGGDAGCPAAPLGKSATSPMPKKEKKKTMTKKRGSSSGGACPVKSGRCGSCRVPPAAPTLAALRALLAAEWPRVLALSELVGGAARVDELRVDWLLGDARWGPRVNEVTYLGGPQQFPLPVQALLRDALVEGWCRRALSESEGNTACRM